MIIFVKKIYSKEDGDFLYGYDLANDTYMGSRYIVTIGLNLDALTPNEALKNFMHLVVISFALKIRRNFSACSIQSLTAL